MRPTWLPPLCLAGLLTAMVAGPVSAADLRLRRAVLTLGGVGTFEYEAAVGADGVATLEVRRADVDDVLKSLVVLDGAASVAGLQLDGPDRASAAFAALPFGAPALAGPQPLLTGLRGVPVLVRDPSGREVIVTGRLLNAARGLEPAAGTANGVERTRVTLLTEIGLRQFVLEDVGAVQAADPALQQRIDAALAALRGEAAEDRRHIRLQLTGAGRTVRVAVVTATPLWKASYRLVLPNRRDTQPMGRLQGWAVLENLSATDWVDVAVSLQAGNPVTFRQALYEPVMVQRPMVPVAAPGRLLPPPDGAAMPSPPAPAPAAAMPMPAMRAVPTAMMAPPVQAASASEGLASTVFVLPNPVSLPAGATASVPFLDQTVPAEPVDLLAADAAHPLAAVRLTNATGNGLPAGAVATFEAGDFAGDAQLPVLADGERRLLTFAEDSAIAAIWQHGATQAVTGLTLSGGVAHITRRQRTTTTIELQSAAPEPRAVLIAVPRIDGATLSATGADLAETTAETWRLRVAITPKEHRTVVATADQLLGEDLAVTDDPATLLQLRDMTALSAAARAAIDHVVALRRDAASRDAERDALQARETQIVHGEERLRANLAAVPAGDPLHARLLRQLDESETALQSLGGEIERAAAAATAAHEAVAAAINALSIS